MTPAELRDLLATLEGCERTLEFWVKQFRADDPIGYPLGVAFRGTCDAIAKVKSALGAEVTK